MYILTCKKVFVRTGIPTHCFNEENRYNRNDNFQQNPAFFFSAATDSESKNILILRRKMQKYFLSRIFRASAGTYL